MQMRSLDIEDDAHCLILGNYLRKQKSEFYGVSKGLQCKNSCSIVIFVNVSASLTVAHL